MTPYDTFMYTHTIYMYDPNHDYSRWLLLSLQLSRAGAQCRFGEAPGEFNMREKPLAEAMFFFGETWQYHKIWSRGLLHSPWSFLSYSSISYVYSSIPIPDIPHSPQSKEWIAQRSARCQSGGGMMVIHIQIQMIIERKNLRKYLPYVTV